VEAEGAELSLGSRLNVRVVAALGGLSSDDVCAEVVYGRAADDDEIIDPCYVTLTPDGDFGGAAHFSGSVELGRPGPFGYTVRLVPRHPLLAARAELGLVTYPDAPAGMTNGDLR
jgi:glycogen phosphorylase